MPMRAYEGWRPHFPRRVKIGRLGIIIAWVTPGLDNNGVCAWLVSLNIFSCVRVHFASFADGTALCLMGFRLCSGPRGSATRAFGSCGCLQIA